MRSVVFMLCLCSWTLCGALAEGLLPAKPEPNSTGSHYGKKGIGLTTSKNNKENWKARVEAVRPDWHYSWGASLPGEEPDGVEFVPMIWGYSKRNKAFTAQIYELTKERLKHSRKHLMGFNEPDAKKQANMSVSRALEAWPQLMRTGLRLGSPATVQPDSEWMQEFMKGARAKRYRVDFVCVHWYGGPNVEGFVRRLQEVHALYGKPIWITEFAVADWNAESRQHNMHSPEVVLRFMKELLPRLDELDFVERYAWFPADEHNRFLGPSALFKADGSLTPLGRLYASHKSTASRTDH